MIRSSKTASTRQIRATSSLTALTASKNCSDTTAMLTMANSTQLATNHSLSRKMLLTKCPPEKTNPPNKWTADVLPKFLIAVSCFKPAEVRVLLMYSNSLPFCSMFTTHHQFVE